MQKIDYQATGRAIRDRRLELGLTQTELGARMGVKKSWVCQLEHLDGDIQLSTLANVGEALECEHWYDLVQTRGDSDEQ